MPVGSLANVKTLTPRDLQGLRADCLLANAYHLARRPGAEIVARLGGLHRFMGWQGPILTDSGGFQIYSLAPLRETSERGVRFLSHLDQQLIELSPERAVGVQELLGADIIMPLDVCLGAGASYGETVEALERTSRWARRSIAARRRADQLLFGIVQGGLDPQLRRQSCRDLVELDLDGYAIGGLSVGEPRVVTERLLTTTVAELPADRPRYLMGVGTPEQVLAYTALGVDMFDCVLPTRSARTGLAFTPGSRLNLKRAGYSQDRRAIDPSCDCQTCKYFSRAYLHNAFREATALGARLLSIHNTRVLLRTASKARAAIIGGRFAQPADAHPQTGGSSGEPRADDRQRSRRATAAGIMAGA
jgi:queuine tRNA-ribosyltransferase